MIGIPFLLLVLASGVYLLIQVESKGLGGVYKMLSWLVVVLALLFIVGGTLRGVIRHRHMAEWRKAHPEFFQAHGRGFGPHHRFGGFGHGNWKGGQPAPADSTATSAK